MPKILSFLRSLIGRRKLEREMEDEVRFHMEAFSDDLIASGVSPQDARRRARAEFGSVEWTKEACRESRGLRWPDEFVRNVRYALRLLRKSPGFTATAVCTLALCIGANTAIFSVVDAVLFRALPYPEPDRIGQIITTVRLRGSEGFQQAQDGAAFEALRDGSHYQLAGMTGGFAGVNLAVDDSARYIQQHRVSAGYFRVLGVPPLLGREISQTEDRAGGGSVVILSWSLWKRTFSADPGVLGRSILLKGEPHTVIGVMPEHFRPMIAADVWTPMRPSTKGEGGGQNYVLLARLKPGSDWLQADAEVGSLGASALLTRRFQPGTEARLSVVPLQQSQSLNTARPLYFLWGAVGIVLLIGCVNMTGLMLARSSTRAREIGTRVALGGGPATVIRQLLTESLVIALLGGASGVCVGYGAIGLLSKMLKPYGIWQELRLDWRVLAVSMVISVLTSVIFGLLPAMQAAAVDLRMSLAEGGSRSVAGSKSHWTRRILVGAEVALSMMLLISAGLLTRTLLNLQSLHPGFDGRGVLTASLSLQDARYATTARVTQLYTKTLDRIREIPGVESAAVGLHVPYQRWLNAGLTFLDGPAASRSGLSMTNANYVTRDYFSTLRVPLRAGRLFDARDGSTTAPVALVNEAFVKRYFPDQEPVGSHIIVRMDSIRREIVGVVGDMLQRPGFSGFGPIDRIPAVYYPVEQVPDQVMQLVHVWFTPSWVVRSSGPREALVRGMQHAVESTDPMLPFAQFETLDSVRDSSLGNQRTGARLLSAIAALALLLSAVGIYGLISHSVEERRRELGIRLALGAGIRRVIFSAAWPAFSLTLAGVMAGSVLGIASSGLLRTVLYGVQPHDPLTLAAVASVLLAISVAATLIPASRLASLDPARTLREE